jgi:AIPR protein
VPDELRANAAELRQAIKDDELKEFSIWYVHNCPESTNVAKEISAVEHSASTAIHKIRANSAVRILAREFGTKQFARLYRASGSPILVTNDIKTNVPTGYGIEGWDWSAYQTFVPGSLIYDLFSTHGTDLFSANVRDYLGSRDSDANINSGIKETATTNPENFWVYNNGITALVNDLRFRKLKTGIQLTIKGISIVNGAQTTGAIGSLAKRPNKDLMVPIRFIWTTNKARVQDIIRFNNSQNKISASDFRSTDAIQKRLKEEFDKIPDSEYEGGRRGGTSDTIRRRPNLLPSYTVGQAIAAFHGDPVTAYNGKSEIWVNDQIYSSYFKEETSAKHIVFAYSLYKTIGDKKLELVGKQKNGMDLTKTEEDQLRFFEKKGSILLTCAAVADCLESVLGKPIPDKFRLSFGEKISPQKAEEFWTDLCPPLLSLVTTLNVAFAVNRIGTEQAKKAIPQFRNVVQAVANPNKATFEKFASRVKID